MKAGIESLVLKFFVGEGDFQEQQPLAEKRKKQGWNMCRTPLEVRQHPVKGRIVVFNGATAADCLASGVISALWGGAKKVIVPLKYVMGSYGEDTDRDKDRELGRGRSLARRLANAGLVDDARLTVTPTRAWRQAKSDFEDFFGE